MLRKKKSLAFYCALVMGFLSILACNSPSALPSGATDVFEGTPIFPTASPTEAALYPSPLPPTATPTEVALNPSPLLEVFPLQIGTTWTYDFTAEIAEGTEVKHYENPLTTTVTDMTVQDGSSIYHLREEGLPDTQTPEGGEFFYILLDSNLYMSYSLSRSADIAASGGVGFEWSQILTWPLEPSQRWGEPEQLDREDGMYSWFVVGIESLETPAGVFDECYRLTIATLPDHAFRWFCPGVGFARFEYHHHGTVHDEVWVLRELTIGS
jgi:hypothetical protein